MAKAPLLGDGLNRTRLCYFLIMGAVGVYLPFINVYLEQDVGLSGRQIGLLAAFGAGLLSFFSPCVAPLVPAYLSIIVGQDDGRTGSTPRRAALRRERCPAQRSRPSGLRRGGRCRRRRLRVWYPPSTR